MTEPLPPLSRPLRAMLVNLYEAGGHGNFHRPDFRSPCLVTVGSSKHPLPGDGNGWTELMAYGYVAGERLMVMLTAEGRALAEEIVAGRTKVAWDAPK